MRGCQATATGGKMAYDAAGELGVPGMERNNSAARPDGRAELRLARQLVADLLRPDPRRFWSDFALGAALAWGTFLAACVAEPWSPAMWAWLAAAALAWYRVSIFIHELAHLRQHELPGFRTAWNALVGVPLLLPSAMYEGVHHGHHRKATFGTRNDPEYLALAGRRGSILLFAAAGALLPLLLLARTLLLAPLAFAVPAWRPLFERRGCAFAINPQYQRQMSDAERRRLRRWDAFTTAAWFGAGAAAAAGWLPWRAFALWALGYGAVSFLNQVRTLVAHRYDSEWRPVDYLGQLRDSIDNPGGWWTELWAPLGLRYHALHHLLPNLPYHNMGTAYRRLAARLPADGVCRSVRSPGFLASLTRLWRFRPAPAEQNQAASAGPPTTVQA